MQCRSHTRGARTGIIVRVARVDVLVASEKADGVAFAYVGCGLNAGHPLHALVVVRVPRGGLVPCVGLLRGQGVLGAVGTLRDLFGYGGG